MSLASKETGAYGERVMTFDSGRLAVVRSRMGERRYQVGTKIVDWGDGSDEQTVYQNNPMAKVFDEHGLDASLLRKSAALVDLAGLENKTLTSSQFCVALEWAMKTYFDQPEHRIDPYFIRAGFHAAIPAMTEVIADGDAEFIAEAKDFFEKANKVQQKG